ncbi:ubiquitin-activating enzyme E1 [Hamiltosporidium magnivora]|uniref:NEDD8-activating enzyme E1 catalytic subunit n=1 Tax=Hamiltosporidium magnivora TaxID=148818 RepID=A0A4Q9LD05_9MICR|nr:ubiquitin-activating enzyme E1 [Hamiltosporidium magnivora]
MQILVLGSELIKLLITQKEYKITLLDYDEIEISNLNRQFMYLKKDIGKNKAEVLCSNLNNRKNKKYKYINTDVLKLKEEDIKHFDIIISCLDNIVARMHINFLIKKSVKNIFFIDSGIENMKIHVKVVKKGFSCLYCIKEMYNTQVNLSFCTIKNIEKNLSKYSRHQIILSLIIQFKEKAKENLSYLSNNLPGDLTKDLSNNLTKDLSNNLENNLSNNLTKDLESNLSKDLSNTLECKLPKDLSNNSTKDLSNNLENNLESNLTKDLSNNLNKIISKPNKISIDSNNRNISNFIESVKLKFNKLALSNNLKPTNSFEIIGIERDIIPNVCYINSIAASLIFKEIKSIKSNKEYDYIFYNSEYKIYTQKFLLSKSDSCILCNED